MLDLFIDTEQRMKYIARMADSYLGYMGLGIRVTSGDYLLIPNYRVEVLDNEEVITEFSGNCNECVAFVKGLKTLALRNYLRICKNNGGAL